MKSYKKILAIAIIATLTLTAVPMLVSADDPITDLIAGQNEDVGDIYVWNHGDYLYIKIVTEDGWELYETHVHVATGFQEFPNHGVNPPPGKFDYKQEHNPPVSEYTYEIRNIWEPDDNVMIAVHAEVCRSEGGLESLEEQLPDQVEVSATHSYPTYDQSYFQVDVSGGTSLDGNYDGWCIDTDHLIHQVPYTANVYSSCETIDPPLVYLEYPGNLDLVNYILNQGYVGTPSGCDGVYTYGDVQLAIWTLVDDNVPTSTVELGPWTQCKVDEILAYAYANGEEFVPGCNDILAVILEPTEVEGNIGQIAIIEVPVPCYEAQCETAWGEGPDLPGSNWAMYFTYTIS